MKNKHLVLIFLLTLLVGLAVRKAPWQSAVFFQSNLLKLDTSEVQHIWVTQPGRPGISFVRMEQGWFAEEQGRSAWVEAGAARQLLGALADLRSIRRVKTKRPDTLGFGLGTAIEVGVLLGDKREEKFALGWETIEDSHAATFVSIPAHQGMYLAKTHLRQVFSRSLADFRDRTATRFSPTDVESVSIGMQGQTPAVFLRDPESADWRCAQPERLIPADSMTQWLQWAAHLTELPFHDLFDESRAEERLFAKIVFHLKKNAAPVTLKVYQAQPAAPPEEIPRPKPKTLRAVPFVLHSSQNPTNYFAIKDSASALRLCLMP